MKAVELVRLGHLPFAPPWVGPIHLNTGVWIKYSLRLYEHTRTHYSNRKLILTVCFCCTAWSREEDSIAWFPRGAWRKDGGLCRVEYASAVQWSQHRLVSLTHQACFPLCALPWDVSLWQKNFRPTWALVLIWSCIAAVSVCNTMLCVEPGYMFFIMLTQFLS